MKFSVIAAAAAIAVYASAGNAAVYTFDFTDNGHTGWRTSFDVQSEEDAGVKVNVTAATYNSDKSINYDDSRAATWQGFGLGVCGDYDSVGHRQGCDDENHRVDGFKNNDLAIFTLDNPLALHSIKFGSYDAYKDVDYEWTCKWDTKWGCWAWDKEKITTIIYDSFDLFIDLGGGLTYQLTDLVAGTVEFDGSLVSSMFGIGASGKHDAFKIKEIVFKHDAPPPVIPLPAAGWLLIAGIGGLAALRRKKAA
jgi:hypothetical protein